MPPPIESVTAFCSALGEINKQAVSTVLIGSVARGAETPKSDIDLLVVGEQQPNIPPIPENFHVHASSKDEFMKKLAEGDDLAGWCVRFGVTIQDQGLWKEIATSPEAKTWPHWQVKILHATRRLMLAASLLATRDLDAAAEEALYAAGHVGQALLLKSNVFPLSRPELIMQTREIGFRRLGGLLDVLLFGQPDERFVRRTVEYLKRLLITLDKNEFARRSKHLTRLASVAKRRAGTNL